MSSLSSLAGARVLVTGATGCVGAALLAQLRAGGVDAVAVARTDTQNAIVIPNYNPTQVATQLRGERFDVVFHLGAAGVKPSEQQPLLLVDGNISFTLALLEAVAVHPPLRIVYTSSSAVYAPKPGHQRLVEDDAGSRPPSLYGAAKRATECMAEVLAAQLALPWVSLRLFGVYGPGEAPHRLIPSLVADLRARRVPTLTAGAQQRDWMYVDDVVEALLLAATQPLHHSLYNVCSGVPISVRTVVETVGAAMGVSSEALGLGRKPYRSDEPFFVVGDPTRFSTDTGFAPQVALVDGIARQLTAIDRLSTGP
jgi:UDP-glucose 4-epimerase